MRNKNIKKYIAIILLAGELVVFPLSASAQISALGVLNPVPTSDGGTSAQNAIFSASMVTPRATFSACLTAVNTADAADNASQLGFTGLSLIGGDSVLMVKLGAKLTAYQVFISCANTVIATVDAIGAPNAYTAQQKQAYITQITSAIQAYKAKLENAQARYNNAKQGFWKTLVLNILIKTSKSVATSLVQKLVSNYKVRNVMQYTDSVATLMYDNQFIRKNFPGSEGQFMARAILENPLVRNDVPSYAFIAADTALGFDPKYLDTNDPDFYVKMSHVGSTVANPYYQHTTNIGGVDQARAQSLQYAQAQVTQGNGLKTPVTCAGSMAQQQSVDQQYKAASDRFDDRYALLKNLQQARGLGQNVSDSDIQKAQTDFDAARNAMKVLPQTVSSPANTICEAIVSPASLIDKGINQAFDALGVNMKQYNDNNLPGFMSLIGDVASQIGSSLIFGGLDGAKGAALINEQRVANAVVQAGTESLYSNVSENLAKGIVFSAERDPNYSDGYVINWDVLTAQKELTNASFITISGDGISAVKIDPTTKASVPNKLPLNGSVAIRTNKGGGYILTVFESTGRAITSITAAINTNSSQAYNNNAEPKVAGAYTTRVPLNIRGEPEVTQPRGPQ